MMANRLLLACGIVLVSIIQLAFGHGFLQVPKSRNYIANLKGQEYCHHCLSAGGPYTVQSLTPGGLYPTPTETTKSAVRHSICGEAANIAASQRKYNPYPAPAFSTLPVYQPGQVMDIEVVITAHHRGHFEFRLCDASKLSNPKTVNWACLDTLLQRVSVPGEISPVDVNHPERYYLEPECAPGYSNTIKMKYQLPSNLTCERCIMQWWWVSANTCNPPDYAQRSPLPAHVATGCNWWVPSLGTCGQSYPEEFWNCADLSIGGAVAAPGTNSVPPPAVPVAPPVAPPVQPVAAPVKPVAPPAQPVAPPTKPAAPPAVPVAPPAKPVAPPVKPVAPPTKPAAPPAQPVAPPTKPVAPPVKPVAPPTKPAVPPAAPTKPVAPPTKPAAAPTKPAAPASACSKSGSQCGGLGWTGATCCASGTTCYEYTEAYSQCRPGACPAGWMCAQGQSNFLSQAFQNLQRRWNQ